MMTSSKPNLKDVLSNAKTIAIIGCSPDTYRTSNFAAKYMQHQGYRIIPINPTADEVAGEKCYPSLSEVPDSIQIDIVNVFRNSKYSAQAVQDAVDWKAKTGQNPVIWTQLDVSSPEAEKIAMEHDLPYIKNKCIMVEWDRLHK